MVWYGMVWYITVIATLPNLVQELDEVQIDWAAGEMLLQDPVDGRLDQKAVVHCNRPHAGLAVGQWVSGGRHGTTMSVWIGIQ